MKSIQRFTIAVAFSYALIFAGAAFGQGTTAGSMDATFAKKAAAGGMAEVQLGKLAQEKGTNSTVKQFGKRMETDHSKANEELKNVASKERITLPTTMDAKDQTTYDRLSKLSGAQFDRAYARDMVQDHQTDIAEFKKEASSGKDTDIKNFASQTVPTLEQHLQLATDMEKSVGGTESSKSKTSSQSQY